MSSLPCHLVRDLLPAACGGELDPATAEAIERHASECLSCRRESLQYEEARVALATLGEGGTRAPRLQEDFFDSLRSGILGEIRRETRVEEDTQILVEAAGSARRGWLATWAPAAAAVLVTLVCGYSLGRVHSPEPRIVHVPGATPVSDAETRSAGALLARPDFAPYLQDALQRFIDSLATENGGAAFGEGLLPVGDFRTNNEVAGRVVPIGTTKDF
ncbi:MAG: zf-HC2 domain-containing protein [Planctomycetes bacterium]|nr:zf-HC2 domain-containing protein [Planctomycetota bacterium]